MKKEMGLYVISFAPAIVLFAVGVNRMEPHSEREAIPMALAWVLVSMLVAVQLALVVFAVAKPDGWCPVRSHVLTHLLLGLPLVGTILLLHFATASSWFPWGVLAMLLLFHLTGRLTVASTPQRKESDPQQ